MAGTIMIRRERDGLFHATPTFTCPGMSLIGPKPEGKGTSPLNAVFDLSRFMPDDIQRKMNGLDRYDFYVAPEYIMNADRCVDLDRHKPTKEERIKRRARFITAIKLGHVKSSWGDNVLALLKNY